MEESKRQKQVAGVINEALNDIFRKQGLNIIDNGMVSIASVKVTPDLLEARIYFSLFQIKNIDEAIKKIEDKHWLIKKELALQIKHQLRRVPELKFYLDDSLDYVEKIEEIFKEINKEKEA
jgi:ribosome-binding factor A